MKSHCNKGDTQGVAQATPTFSRSKEKSIVGDPNFRRKKALNRPPQLKIPTYGPENVG